MTNTITMVTCYNTSHAESSIFAVTGCEGINTESEIQSWQHLLMGFTFSNHQLPMLEILKDHLKIESVSALTFTYSVSW